MAKRKMVMNILFWIAMIVIAIPHIGSLLDIELFSNLNLISHPIGMLGAVAVASLVYMMRGKK